MACCFEFAGFGSLRDGNVDGDHVSEMMGFRSFQKGREKSEPLLPAVALPAANEGELGKQRHHRAEKKVFLL